MQNAALYKKYKDLTKDELNLSLVKSFVVELPRPKGRGLTVLFDKNKTIIL